MLPTLVPALILRVRIIFFHSTGYYFTMSTLHGKASNYSTDRWYRARRFAQRSVRATFHLFCLSSRIRLFNLGWIRLEFIVELNLFFMKGRWHTRELIWSWSSHVNPFSRSPRFSRLFAWTLILRNVIAFDRLENFRISTQMWVNFLWFSDVFTLTRFGFKVNSLWRATLLWSSTWLVLGWNFWFWSLRCLLNQSVI